MATQKEELIVRAGFDSTALASGLRSTVGQVQHWGKEIGRYIAGAFALEKLVEFQKGIFEFAKSISLTAERLGVTTDEVQKLQYAGAMTGVALDTVASALEKLARAKEKALGGGAGGDQLIASFARFGITMKELQTLAPDQLFDKISESVEKTGVNSVVTADAMELMGRSGGRLLPLLKEFREQSKNAPIISEEDLATLRKASEEMEGLWMKTKVYFANLEVNLGKKSFWKDYFNYLRGVDPEWFKDHMSDVVPVKSAAGAGGGSDEAAGSGPANSKGGNAGDLYERRAQLLRQMGDFRGAHSYAKHLDQAAELRAIQDEIDQKNAPGELDRLKVERGQAARDLRIEQSHLPVGEAARSAEQEKIYSLAARLKGIDSKIVDYNKSNLEKIADHASKQTTAMEKIAGAVEAGKLNVKIPSN